MTTTREVYFNLLVFHPSLNLKLCMSGHISLFNRDTIMYPCPKVNADLANLCDIIS